MRHIAVLDVGKTNAKLALVDLDTLEEIAVRTRPNKVLPGPPFPHFDLDGHWQFFCEGLRDLHARYGVDAISVTTHGAAITLIGQDGHALPMLDYECIGPDDLMADYDCIRPPFPQTGSPRLPMGLNIGAQLHWMFTTDPSLRDRVRHVLTYPQYWGYRLTGAVASDVSSLGCHTDLWLPGEGRYSDLPDRLGIAGKMAPPRRPGEVLGPLSVQAAAETGLPAGIPVAVGIHDSNASLLPHLLSREGAFSVVSTGTWVIMMAMRGAPVTLDPARDTLINVNALGEPVPSARFMGGREFDLVNDGWEGSPTDADRAAVFRRGVRLMPSVVAGSGPFPNRKADWPVAAATTGERRVALSYYLALMTAIGLRSIGAQGPAIVEGPFGKNADYMAMLAAVIPAGVVRAASATGTSVGAALLLAADHRPALHDPVQNDDPVLRRYADIWATDLGEAGFSPRDWFA